ncbi:phosphoadenylylsulfate reductase (thioredoxin) [Nitrosospira sp. Nl5]|uniref:phosphoadenylyl-sulfate reductase n=1 Tax=Nitrosospira sp. Nl5 TaxID=200120 RepID=UPI00088E97C8|nr:phosphoadenylyl-sulfate reductase [Nitrosospira sp. Nl5]SCY73423.1 phosphoadenylylsulfate reductase (thioredoxin) [Nitrosospira sp. Nl5]
MTLDHKIATMRTLLDTVQAEYAPVVFANSFGAEDMVLTDIIARHYPGIEMFTLDTGRLPEETYSLMREVAERYGIRVPVYFPEPAAVEAYVAQNGPNGFYDSVELRKTCCHIRKVEPLKRALRGKRAWITGLRRDQAPTRKNLAESEFDADNGLQKISPLLDWRLADVWAYLKQFDVPYNALHDKGYTSIGCAPCTRAITPGEDVRAGRWWWENPEIKECGLHSGKRNGTAASVSVAELAISGQSRNPEEKGHGRIRSKSGAP